MRLHLITIGFICLAALGCAQTAKPSCLPHYYVHRITIPGETIAAIAAWYTGREENWKYFYLPARFRLSGKLKRGDEVLIPYSLLSTEKPLAPAFVKYRADRAPQAADRGSVRPQASTGSEISSEPHPDQIKLENEPENHKQELEGEFIDRFIE